MTDMDREKFDEAFSRLVTAFRLKLKAADLDTLAQTYFRVLAPCWSIDEVLAGGRVCLEKHRRFPKVADWLAELPSRSPSPTRSTDHRWMTADEMEAHDRAAHLAYQDHPCDCRGCVAAGVSDKPLRFVPNDDGERAYHARRQQVEDVGHWAHGDQLARWYAARETFFNKLRTSTRYPRVVELVRDREPGEDG
jgi:hypothetical protein